VSIIGTEINGSGDSSLHQRNHNPWTITERLDLMFGLLSGGEQVKLGTSAGDTCLEKTTQGD
jgi:hypothetical protein